MRHDIDFRAVVPIPNCLPLMENETSSSYLARLSAYYGYASISGFCLDFGLYRKGIMFGNADDVRHLAALTGADFDRLAAWTPTRLGKFRYVMNGVHLDGEFGPRLQVRQCPLCAQASILANPDLPPDLCLYGRGEWLSGYVDTCDIHGVRLMEQRTAPANIELIDPVRLQEAIFEELADVVLEYREPTSFERHALSVMRHEPRESLPYVDEIQMPELMRVCLALGRDIAASKGTKGLDARTLRSSGFDLLSSGSAGLSSFFAGMKAMAGRALATRGVLTSFQNFYRNSRNPQIAALSHQVWCIFNGREVSGRLLPTISPSDLAGEGFVDVNTYPVEWPVILELAGTVPELTPCLSIDQQKMLVSKDVADLLFLGKTPLVPQNHLANLLGRPGDAGRLMSILEPAGVVSGPFAGTELLRTGPVYARPVLEREVETFLAPYPRVDAVPPGMISLHRAAKVVQTATVGLMTLLGRRLLYNVVVLEGKPLINALHLDPCELLEVVYGSATTLTSTEVGKQLNVPQSLVGHLIRSGHLAAAKCRVEGVDAALLKVTQAEVDRFKQSYMTHQEACHATGAKSYRGLAKLGLRRALIIDSPWDNQHPKVFYARDEVQALVAAA